MALRAGEDFIPDFYGFIYITKNKINGKRYIGQKRFDRKSYNYLGSGTLLLKAINKYGKESFERKDVLYCETREELNHYEKLFIEEYNAPNSESFYNIANGGEGGRGEYLIKDEIICINNGMIFKNIAYAALWAGCTKKTVIRSFNYANKMLEDSYVVFRKYKFHKIIKYCRFCGENFVSSNGMQKTCHICKKYYDSNKEARQRYDNRIENKRLSHHSRYEVVEVEGFKIRKGNLGNSKSCRQCGVLTPKNKTLCKDCIKKNTRPTINIKED